MASLPARPAPAPVTDGPNSRHRSGRLWHAETTPLYLGAAVAIAYVLCAAIAALQFPKPFGPWRDNTLSQLGNATLNPGGHTVYLVGCGVAGALAIAFFASVGRWKSSGTRTQNRLLTLVQVLGVVGGLGLFMNAIFPETNYGQHHFWAGLLFNAFAATALVAIPALTRPDRSTVALIAFNAAAFTAVILMFVFASVHWVEWLPSALFLMLPLVLAVLARGLEKAPAG